MSETGIAWQSDINNKFKFPTNLPPDWQSKIQLLNQTYADYPVANSFSLYVTSSVVTQTIWS
jgi:hypothetical protein